MPDDSERSYGYSEDIYHGRVKPGDEKSYEYGSESKEAGEPVEELSPEEAAVHIEGGTPKGDWTPPARGEGYDSGREGTYASVDSFTWDLEPETEEAGTKPRKGE
jgi:hypothetical protein